MNTTENTSPPSAALRSIREQSLTVLRGLLSPGPAALIDFPSHANAGDSLIYAGEVEYFSQLGISLPYIADIHSFDADNLRRHCPTGPILINGGGNFGDRWTHSQALKERLITSFGDRQIIQLPQSIDFSSESALQRTRNIYAAHRNLTILIRDNRSLATVSREFSENTVLFCPDLALGWQPPQTHFAPTHDVVMLLREDSESISDAGRFVMPAGVTSVRTDWGHQGLQKLPWSVAQAPRALARVVPNRSGRLDPLLAWSYRRISDLNIAVAVQTLGQGRVVITDRLHAMVLAALLGLPVIAMDNANGKVRSIYNDYVHELDSVVFCEDADQLGTEVLSLLGRS